MGRLSKDVRIMIGLLLLLLIVGIFAYDRQQGNSETEMFPKRTTYSARPGGLKALYVTLGKLGYRVDRRLSRLTPPLDDGVLFIVSPEQPLSQDEWDAVRAWVERGNTLVLAGNQPPNPDALGHEPLTTKASALAPSFLSVGVRSLRVAGSDRIDDTEMEFGGSASLGSSYG